MPNPTPYLGEIRMIASSAAPAGWAACNGQLLVIGQNQALFSLLGTTYGGNGSTTFALPDLRGRVPMHVGNGHNLGEQAGEASHTVTIAELPAHTHVAQASGAPANANASSGSLLAVSQGSIYLNPAQTTPALTPVNAQTVSNVGGSQPHPNEQPFIAITFIIALQGIFPS